MPTNSQSRTPHDDQDGSDRLAPPAVPTAIQSTMPEPPLTAVKDEVLRAKKMQVAAQLQAVEAQPGRGVRRRIVVLSAAALLVLAAASIGGTLWWRHRQAAVRERTRISGRAGPVDFKARKVVMPARSAAAI
jgi:hypothetical protein